MRLRTERATHTENHRFARRGEEERKCQYGREHLWGFRPIIWLVLSSVADVLIISTLAVSGIAMAPLPISLIAGEFAAAIAFGVVLDGLKVPIFAKLQIA